MSSRLHSGTVRPESNRTAGIGPAGIEPAGRIHRKQNQRLVKKHVLKY